MADQQMIAVQRVLRRNGPPTTSRQQQNTEPGCDRDSNGLASEGAMDVPATANAQARVVLDMQAMVNQRLRILRDSMARHSQDLGRLS